jgi:hypothetical protein
MISEFKVHFTGEGWMPAMFPLPHRARSTFRALNRHHENPICEIRFSWQFIIYFMFSASNGFFVQNRYYQNRY